MKVLTCLMLEGRFLSSKKRLVMKNAVQFVIDTVNHSSQVPVLRSHPQEYCPTLHMQMGHSGNASDYPFNGLSLLVVIIYFLQCNIEWMQKSDILTFLVSFPGSSSIIPSSTEFSSSPYSIQGTCPISRGNGATYLAQLISFTLFLQGCAFENDKQEIESTTQKVRALTLKKIFKIDDFFLKIGNC